MDDRADKPEVKTRAINQDVKIERFALTDARIQEMQNTTLVIGECFFFTLDAELKVYAKNPFRVLIPEDPPCRL